MKPNELTSPDIDRLVVDLADQGETAMFGGYPAWKNFIKDGLAADGVA